MIVSSFKKIIALALVIGWSVQARSQSAKPNILWIVSEDNSTFLGCYGDKYATTPNLDKFSTKGILYENAFSTAPVCAPSRCTLITGMLPTTLGTENMRSSYPSPSFIKFFPKYLRESGYYTTNNAKKDYNTGDQADAWDESSNTATYKNRKSGQPFFAVFNLNISHESNIHGKQPDLRHDPSKAPVPPYHPGTEEMKHDWALYYDKVEQMDQQAGKLLRELEEAGLAENTIVFYYADNGGVLPRSKRFMFESGLHVPLIIRFPEKYRHLAPQAPGTRTDRLVTFLDFAPSILNLTGIKIPEYMQGRPFAGPVLPAENKYAFNFRGRMDETEDKIRSLRDKRFRYIRNYYPHKIYGQHVAYSWKAPSMQSWEREYRAGTLNETQLVFWKEKPSEELYDVVADPHNINNLAGKKEYQADLERLRKQLHKTLVETRDIGFIPEAQLEEIAKSTAPYDFARSSGYDVARVLETAELASSRDPKQLPEITKRLKDKDAVVRYWAATGITILGTKASSAKAQVSELLNDQVEAVRIAAAEAVYKLGEKNQGLAVISSALNSTNNIARVQAFNVLLSVERKDLGQFNEKLKTIVADSNSTVYDLSHARYLLSLTSTRANAKK
ncbi:sulfatase-like hydrolase/transferase [Desertivirga arenae]|uniref:sulfatase-like hydrolase/transferase n=1 Tax=Desertivirga arenae TaxID=2810309 RepID=UPI001A967BD5|nr:sulfatase-like hydrolase/transferase [Pedobacter sp. SYSU D00823]